MISLLLQLKKPEDLSQALTSTGKLCIKGIKHINTEILPGESIESRNHLHSILESTI
jgi:hypothetical protein